MAETLNLGTNGNWATKKESLLAYNDENNNFKPLPFSFTRNSSATRVNKEGLIEVVSNNEPRIDFKDSSEGSLLLEPSRSNYVAYSELPSTWTYTEFGSGSNGTITTGKTDMFGGTNAVQIDFPSNAENVSIRFGSTTSSLSSGSATISLYIKLVESGSKNLQLRAGFNGIINVNSTEFTRVDLSGTKTNTELFNLKLRPSEGTSSGGFSIIICHPQEENGSYATSYIPTSGQVNGVTRSADVCNGAGNDQVINSTEGVLYVETKGFEILSTQSKYIVLSSPTISFTNAVVLQFRSNGDLRLYVGGSGSANIQFLNSSIDFTENNKIAVQYDSNGSNYKMFVNGVSTARYSLATNQSVVGLSELNFNYSTLPFYGKVKDLRVYNTVLTDQELIALTS